MINNIVVVCLNLWENKELSKYLPHVPEEESEKEATQKQTHEAFCVDGILDMCFSTSCFCVSQLTAVQKNTWLHQKIYKCALPNPHFIPVLHLGLVDLQWLDDPKELSAACPQG